MEGTYNSTNSTETAFPIDSLHSMASSPLEKIAVAFIILILSLLIHKFYRQISQSRGYKLPPGPWGWPLIGNLLDFPSQRPWTVLRDWSHTYGDMFCLRLMGSRMLVVSTADIALELMEKRSAIYSDKPVFPMAELTGWDFNLGIMPYGQRWRSIRAHFHQNFNSLAVPDYHGIQTVQIYAFLRRELEHAGKKHDPASIRLTLAAIILDIVYGLEVHSMEDEYLELIAKASEYFVEGLSLGKFWVNFIPILKYVPPWVPGAAAAKYGAESRPVVREMAEKPFRDIQSGVNQNPSVARKLFMRLVQEPDAGRRETQLQHVKDCTGLAYIVASETTFSVIQTFFCTMAMYPDIQQKAQKELERVVGPERLPTYDDYEELPYVQAIFLECMRWLPVTPLGLSHRVIQDDHYNGHFIPKGTIIVPNIWQMLRDPNDYPDPERFNPDRFMKDGVLNREVRDPLTLAFGFGRRICPGRHLAQDNAFLTIASTLHVFDIMPSLDENGRQMDPTPEVTTGVTSCADRFNYMLKPRSVAAEGLIRATQDV